MYGDEFPPNMHRVVRIAGEIDSVRDQVSAACSLRRPNLCATCGPRLGPSGGEAVPNMGPRAMIAGRNTGSDQWHCYMRLSAPGGSGTALALKLKSNPSPFVPAVVIPTSR